MSFNCEKFMIKNCADMKEGKKDWHETISQPRVRHSFAQNRFEKKTPGKAKEVVSRNLDHERVVIPDIYLNLIKTKKRSKSYI